LLRQFDDTLRTGLITILNVDINNDQWLQASLPIGDGGLGIRSAEMLASSAYLASAASTLLLQQSILPDSIWMQGDQSVASTETLWTGVANSPKPSQQTQPIQKAWDGPIAANHTHTHTHNTHPFNGPFSRTTRMSRYQKGKTKLDFNEARDSEWQQIKRI